MRRLAYICADPGVPVFGRKGASVHVQEVIRALTGRGVDITLFAARLGGDPPNDLAGVHVIALPETAAKDPALRERRLLELNLALARLLGDAGHFDAVYERHSLWSFAAMEGAQQSEIPGILEVNAPLLVEQAGYRTLHDEAGARAAVGRAFQAADSIVAVSQGVASYMASFAPGLAEKVHVVPNGVDPKRFEVSQARSLEDGDGAFTVGFVGTLKPWHGVDTLIEAFARVRSNGADARLLIVGDGPERSALAAQAAQLGVSDSVEFTGAVDPAEIPVQLARMDVAVAPYPALADFYFSPLKVYEYMAAGRAIIASAIGQITDVLTHEKTGFLYRPGDVQGLAEAIARLRREPLLRSRLSAAARRAALERHTWDQVAERILTLADEVRSRPRDREVTVQ